ncbi:hypothetical protein NMY22_g6461 [Coprinellus aureogranulatus]|nr:hypothetical protein NMY22_g6461 [Coprinellus aureogranulatus]
MLHNFRSFRQALSAELPRVYWLSHFGEEALGFGPESNMGISKTPPNKSVLSIKQEEGLLEIRVAAQQGSISLGGHPMRLIPPDQDAGHGIIYPHSLQSKTCADVKFFPFRHKM